MPTPRQPTTFDLLREIRLVLRFLIEELFTQKNLLRQILQKEKDMAADLTALTAQVAENTSAEASAITLLNGLSAQLASIATDPVAVAALAAELKSSGDALAAAIVANTPATA